MKNRVRIGLFAALLALYAAREPEKAVTVLQDVSSLIPCAEHLSQGLRDHFESSVGWDHIQQRELRMVAAVLQTCRDVDEVSVTLNQIPVVGFGSAAMRLVQDKLLGLRPALLALAAAEAFGAGPERSEHQSWG